MHYCIIKKIKINLHLSANKAENTHTIAKQYAHYTTEFRNVSKSLQ